MAARGFFVCRAAGGLPPSRWRPKARGAAAGHRPGPGSAARAACEAGRLDPVKKVLTPIFRHLSAIEDRWHHRMMSSPTDTAPSSPPPERGRVMLCPHCELPSIQAIKGIASVSAENPEDPGCPSYEYTLLQCNECREPSLQVETFWGPFANLGHERPDFIYPASRQLSEHVPEPIRREFEEARACFGSNSYTATVVMVRRTLEGICQDNGIAERNLATALERMERDGLIDKTIATWATQLRLLGNQGAHFTGRPISREDASDALTFTEALLDQIYVLVKRFAEFQKRRDGKPV
ncbi:DUF4145 domain-containing protein [Micromonospora chalcea]